MPLKTNLHFHSSEDPEDIISYDFYQAIDKASLLGFEVLAWTCHNKFVYKEKYSQYASQKNILIIPGIEKSIKNKHVVILNCDKEAEKINTFQDLADYKTKHPEILVMAPHPFFPSSAALGKHLEENINIFDAIELSWYYTKRINFNLQAEKIAEKYNKPFIATSDTHFLWQLNTSFTFIDTKKNINSIMEAIKEKKIKNDTKPVSFFKIIFFQLAFMTRWGNIKKKLKRKSF